jgi:hypothetical protein
LLNWNGTSSQPQVTFLRAGGRELLKLITEIFGIEVRNPIVAGKGAVPNY